MILFQAKWFVIPFQMMPTKSRPLPSPLKTTIPVWLIQDVRQCLLLDVCFLDFLSYGSYQRLSNVYVWGVKCIEACCCCCCRSQSNTAYQQPPQTYINPNMYPDAQYNQRYAYQPQPPMSAYPGPSNDSVKSEYGYNNHDGYEPVSNNNTNYQSPFNDRYKYQVDEEYQIYVLVMNLLSSFRWCFLVFVSSICIDWFM